jgi:hypothetical protein
MAEITEQIVREAPGIEAYKLGLLESAKALSNQPVNLPGYQVAGLSPDQTQAFDMARQGIGAYQPYLYGGGASLGAAAMGTLGNTANIGQQDIQNYMNPYSNLALQQQLQEMSRQAQMQGQQLNAQTARAGAFGGSRDAIQRAEMNRNLSQTQNQAIAQSMQQNYAQALAAAQQQRQSNLAAYGQLGNLGVQQAALGEAAQKMGQSDVNFLYNVGQQQQQFNQAQLDAARNTALQQSYEPYQRLSYLSDIYKGAPSSQQSITAATAPTASTAQQVAGLGIAGLSAGAAASKAGLFG